VREREKERGMDTREGGGEKERKKEREKESNGRLGADRPDIAN
jgi:hypothetical protein